MRTNTATKTIAVALLLGIAACSTPTDTPQVAAPQVDQLRVHNDSEAEARRTVLRSTIWPDGFPADTPVVRHAPAVPVEVAAVDRTLIRDVDVATVDVLGLSSTVFVLNPVDPIGRLAIVHQGHEPNQLNRYLSGGLAETVDMLLDAGYRVAVMQMPLAGWNTDRTGVLPGGTFTVPQAAMPTASHQALFDLVGPSLGVSTFRFFAEPVVQVVNAFGTVGTVMVGLSGGGWTTHVAAAVDPRIQVSVPVAGSLPLSVRPDSPGSEGDVEQVYGLMFGPDGVASWLDIYALGATAGRTQVQVLNLYDACCFSGRVFEGYSSTVSAVMHGWSVFSDDSHREHKISEHARSTVLLPLLASRPSD